MAFPYISDLINYYFGTSWSIPIAMFGLFIALAIVVAASLAKREVIRFEKQGRLPSLTVTNKATHQLVGDLAMITALAGVVGARIFHILEYPNEFMSNPMDMIFSRQGLSIYGGLVVGAIAGAIFLRKHSVPLLPMLDALAPALILGYGIGRIGCQISGDGDWGIAANMALRPAFIPDWFWAQTYQHNIAGVLIPAPCVFITPQYVTVMAFFIFGILWLAKKSHYQSGYLFSLYLVLSGFARLLIEKIRINTQYQLFDLHFTQAEFISTFIIVIGLIGILKKSGAKSFPKVAFTLVVLSALSACSTL